MYNLAQSTEPTWPPKARSHETIHRFRVKPADVGIVGFVDGGTLLEWIDKAAARPVPKWEPASDEDHRLDQLARDLIELRRFNEPFTTAAAVPADAEPPRLHYTTIAH